MESSDGGVRIALNFKVIEPAANISVKVGNGIIGRITNITLLEEHAVECYYFNYSIDMEKNPKSGCWHCKCVSPAGEVIIHKTRAQRKMMYPSFADVIRIILAHYNNAVVPLADN